VFRSFSRSGGEFRFDWLWGQPFRLTFDRKTATLEFRDLLPNLPARSELERGLRSFVRRFSAKELPSHRCVDPAILTVRYENRRGRASLAFTMRANDPEYAVRKALQVVNEVFLGFLNLYYPEYMAENFRLPME
jgi:hypothetical protein